MELKELLERALDEVTSLRRANEILQAQVHVFESCAAMVNAEPPRRGYGAMHPDVAYELRQRLDGMTKEAIAAAREIRMAWRPVDPADDKAMATAERVAAGVRDDLAKALKGAAKKPMRRKRAR